MIYSVRNIAIGSIIYVIRAVYCLFRTLSAIPKSRIFPCAEPSTDSAHWPQEVRPADLRVLTSMSEFVLDKAPRTKYSTSITISAVWYSHVFTESPTYSYKPYVYRLWGRRPEGFAFDGGGPACAQLVLTKGNTKYVR